MPGPRSKQSPALDYSTLEGLFRDNFPTAPAKHHYSHEDYDFVCGQYQSFFVKVAELSPRLNQSSMAVMARDYFHFSPSDCKVFGTCMAAAFNHAMTAGNKAKTGEKLAPAVVLIYNTARSAQSLAPLASVKKEEVEQKAAVVKKEPRTKLEKTLSSPSQIDKLYAGTLMPAKKEPMEVKEMKVVGCGLLYQMHSGGLLVGGPPRRPPRRPPLACMPVIK